MSECIHSWQEQNDKRYLFLSCYAAMTGNMISAVEAGEFKDPAWVTMLLERFAGYYFEGLERCECGAQDRPRVWDFTHKTTRHCDLHVMQYLLLGINAHINYDLVLTLHEILGLEWADADEDTRAIRQQDHQTVNEVIARTIDIVQDEVIEQVSPMMDILDRLMGRVDEYLLSRLIRNWRSDVWTEAMQMLATNDADQIQLLKSRLEEKVILKANHILLR